MTSLLSTLLAEAAKRESGPRSSRHSSLRGPQSSSASVHLHHSPQSPSCETLLHCVPPAANMGMAGTSFTTGH